MENQSAAAPELGDLANVCRRPGSHVRAPAPAALRRVVKGDEVGGPSPAFIGDFETLEILYDQLAGLEADACAPHSVLGYLPPEYRVEVDFGKTNSPEAEVFRAQVAAHVMANREYASIAARMADISEEISCITSAILDRPAVTMGDIGLKVIAGYWHQCMDVDYTAGNRVFASSAAVAFQSCTGDHRTFDEPAGASIREDFPATDREEVWGPGGLISTTAAAINRSHSSRSPMPAQPAMKAASGVPGEN